MQKLYILNSGGTINKFYNEISGTLEVAQNNDVIEEIVEKSFRGNLNLEIEGIVYKDSLDLTLEDRKIFLNKIKNNYKTILVHGTDTMDLTAKFLEDNCEDKIVILTGAMMPYSINKTEAVSNFSIAISFAQTCEKNGIYIAMHGLVKPYKEIKKNKTLGIFECQ